MIDQNQTLPLPEWPAHLRDMLVEYFNLPELTSLCLDVGVDFEELGEGVKSRRVVRLIKLMADGTAIAHADFTIVTQDQSKIIYENREDQAAYCVFQGGLPNCNPWVEQNGRFFWPNGVAVESGSDHTTILVYPQHPEFQDEDWNWDFDFWIELP